MVGWYRMPTLNNQLLRNGESPTLLLGCDVDIWMIPSSSRYLVPNATWEGLQKFQTPLRKILGVFRKTWNIQHNYAYINNNIYMLHMYVYIYVYYKEKCMYTYINTYVCIHICVSYINACLCIYNMYIYIFIIINLYVYININIYHSIFQFGCSLNPKLAGVVFKKPQGPSAIHGTTRKDDPGTHNTWVFPKMVGFPNNFHGFSY